MKSARLLDSYAILAYLKGESSAEQVAQAIRRAGEGKNRVLMNEINVGEAYYILARERSMEAARRFVFDILPQLPIEVLGNTFESVIAAAEVKARLPLAYADAFAISTAIREGASIITGDREFRAAEKEVTIEWL